VKLTPRYCSAWYKRAVGHKVELEAAVELAVVELSIMSVPVNWVSLEGGYKC